MRHPGEVPDVDMPSDGYVFVNWTAMQLPVRVQTRLEAEQGVDDETGTAGLLDFVAHRLARTLQHWQFEPVSGGMDFTPSAMGMLRGLPHDLFRQLFPKKLRGLPMHYPEAPYESDYPIVRMRLCNWDNPFRQPGQDRFPSDHDPNVTMASMDGFKMCYAEHHISARLLKEVLEVPR